MPPKVLYGKRTAVRPTNTFANFLTPEREDGAETATAKGRGKQRKNSAKKDDTEEEDPLADIEKGLAQLKVVEKDGEDEAANEKRRARRNVLKDTDGNIETKRKTKSGKNARNQTQHEESIDRPKSREGARKSRANARRKKASTPTQLPEVVQLPTPQGTPEPEDLYSAYVSQLLKITYDKKIIAFEDWAASLEPHFEITKIAEASFSEVYRLTAAPATTGINQESVLKVVALRTPPNAPLPCQTQERTTRDPERQEKKEMAEREEHDSWKSHVEDVYSEVRLLQNLNDIPGFTNFRELAVLQGRPSTSFANAWKVWNKSRSRGRKSEFPDPSKKMSYESTQLWAVIEMQDAGTDCEKIMEAGGLGSVWEVWDVFWGVCLSVAKAEEACKFEHRDMHLENICIRSSQPGRDVTVPIIKDPIRKKFGFSGLETTVIDYTLSRADVVSSSLRSLSSTPSKIRTPSPSEPYSSEPEVAYLDLDKDPGVFEGDASEEYQYEIYRYMRGAALYNNPLQSAPVEPDPPIPQPRRSPRKNTHIRFPDDNDGDANNTQRQNTHIHFSEPDTPRRSPRKSIAPVPIPTPTKLPSTPSEPTWRAFHPKTNLIWLHYILHRLLTHLEPHKPSTLSPTTIMQNIEKINPDNADEEQDQDQDVSRIRKKALRLHKILQKVDALLRPERLGEKECLGSVKELVLVAMEERWLRVGDVAGE